MQVCSASKWSLCGNEEGLQKVDTYMIDDEEQHSFFNL